MNAKDVFSNVMVATAVLCAVIATGVILRRELVAEKPGAREEPVLLDDPQQYAVGRYIGPPNAKVRIIEFSDFQCPFCKQFADSTWSVVKSRFPNDVALIYRHWPLKIHKHAYAAARASECAAEQGQFSAFHDILFKKQDSIGIKSYMEFASEAGVPDTVAFKTCNTSTDVVATIERDILAARSMQAKGTPAIIVNNRRFPSNPSKQLLLSTIEEELRRLKE